MAASDAIAPALPVSVSAAACIASADPARSATARCVSASKAWVAVAKASARIRSRSRRICASASKSRFSIRAVWNAAMAAAISPISSRRCVNGMTRPRSLAASAVMPSLRRCRGRRTWVTMIQTAASKPQHERHRRHDHEGDPRLPPVDGVPGASGIQAAQHLPSKGADLGHHALPILHGRLVGRLDQGRLGRHRQPQLGRVGLVGDEFLHEEIEAPAPILGKLIFHRREEGSAHLLHRRKGVVECRQACPCLRGVFRRVEGRGLHHRVLDRLPQGTGLQPGIPDPVRRGGALLLQFDCRTAKAAMPIATRASNPITAESLRPSEIRIGAAPLQRGLRRGAAIHEHFLLNR